MPFIRGSRRSIGRSLAVVAAGLAAAGAIPAAAAAACTPTPTTKAFAPFGDEADYSLAPNGHFEAGTAGWSLRRAFVANGNETFKVHGQADARSLALQPTGSAVTPSLCVGIEHPTFRFFARRNSGTWGVLNVALRWADSSGRVNQTTVGALSGDQYKSWTPAPAMALASALPLWQAGSSLQVSIVFDPEDYGGAWSIDDVYVDPYARR